MVKRSVALSKKASFYKATQSRIARLERAINRHVASVARLESLFQNPKMTFDAKRCASFVKSLETQCEYFNNQLSDSMKSFRAAIALGTPTDSIVKNIRSLSNLVTRIALLQAVAESSTVAEDMIKLDDAGFVVEDEKNKVEAKCGEDEKNEAEAKCGEDKKASVSVKAEGEDKKAVSVKAEGEDKEETKSEEPKEESKEETTDNSEVPSDDSVEPTDNSEAPSDDEAIEDFGEDLPEMTDFPMDDGLGEEDIEDILNEKLPEDKNSDGINDATEEVLDEIQQQVYDQGDRIQNIEENLGIDTPLIEESEENSEKDMINVSSNKKSAKIQQQRLASCKAGASNKNVDILSAIIAQDIR